MRESERSTAGSNDGKVQIPSRPSASQKPVSQLERANPRQFQIGQLIKRFSPIQKEVNDATVLSFTLKPSDPDFPFDLAGLNCHLTVPASYPENGTPTLRVTNAEMARGFQINVERGFDSLAAEDPRKSLLALMNDLDKKLEQFLTAEKAQTIKLVSNADRRHLQEVTPQAVPQVVQIPLPKPEKVSVPAPSWSTQQLSDAKAKRQSDVRQLEARMGRLSGFSKSSDETKFNIPVQIPNAARLPVSLQPLKEITLIVPKLYNLQPCAVHLNGVYGDEVEQVQLSFEKRAREQPAMTLMAHVNYLIQNVHTMAVEALKTTASQPAIPEAIQPRPIEGSVAEEKGTEQGGRMLDPDHPHVLVIPRPPEWDHHDSDSEEDSDSYDSEDYTDSDGDYDEENDGIDGGTTLPGESAGASSTPQEKGILLSFPNLELHGIELLTISSLSLSVKCLRCKTSLDVSNIKPSLSQSTTDGRTASTTTSTRTESCPKCASSFLMTFTPQLLHQSSIRAGTVEVVGCTIGDMLPSTFQPTCSSCSTPFPSPPGVVSVRGDTPIQVCRSCHAKMTFTIPEVKFLRLSAAARDLPVRKPRRENLGVTTGTPLPLNGTCSHYSHSYRWFRFSCCGRVYPCDRCHDAAEAHVNDRAERMLCGWCSREQRFRPEDCGHCGRSVIRRRRGGGAGRFWEGGKGTRERGLMSRKDKRKYRNKRPDGQGAAGGGKKA